MEDVLTVWQYPHFTPNVNRIETYHASIIVSARRITIIRFRVHTFCWFRTV